MNYQVASYFAWAQRKFIASRVSVALFQTVKQCKNLNDKWIRMHGDLCVFIAPAVTAGKIEQRLQALLALALSECNLALIS